MMSNPCANAGATSVQSVERTLLSADVDVSLQSVQIRQQVVDLLLTEDLGVAWHLVAPQANDIRDPVVIRRHPAHWQIWPLENTFHAGALPAPRRVRRMATVAIIVVNPAPSDLLRIESEFSVTLAALDFATGQKRYHHHRAA